jgi:uncharacterized iron-regulated protein
MKHEAKRIFRNNRLPRVFRDSTALAPSRAAIHRAVNLCALSGVLFFLAGCCGTGVSSSSPRPNPPPVLHRGEVIETSTGRVMDMDGLAARLARDEVIYVGEMHTSAQDHQVQLEILRKLARDRGYVQLAMEMFPANAQPILDRYIDGRMPEQDFLKEVQWKEVWGFPYSLYKGLIDFQKERGMPVIGLNAPYRVVKKIGRHGLGSLTPRERSQVARVFHREDLSNRERIKKDFMAHGRYEIKDFQSFFEAQLAWEETMAQTLARRLDQTHCPIMVVLGRGHISKRFGVPHLTLLRRPRTTLGTVVPVPSDYPAGAIGPDLADYVVITGKSEPSHPRLGVIIEPAKPGPGVRIAGVMPGTAADAAHLHKADIILAVNGAAVKEVKDVQRALAKSGPACTLLIERNNVRLRVEVSIPPDTDKSPEEG